MMQYAPQISSVDQLEEEGSTALTHSQIQAKRLGSPRSAFLVGGSTPNLGKLILESNLLEMWLPGTNFQLKLTKIQLIFK